MKTAVVALAGVGGALMAGKAAGWLGGIWRNLVRPRRCLAERYGQGSWVVITGGSSGIGLAFAKAFGELKFNLVLIDRDPQVIRVANELSHSYRIETLPVILDFSETISGEQDFISVISEKLGGLDVSVLVNNVGEFLCEGFSTAATDVVSNVLRVNVRVTTRLTHELLPRLLRRKQKSAIINMASMAGLIPSPFIAVYSATKAYIRFFSLALEKEVGDKVDVLAGEPSVVKTNMSKRVDHGFFSVEPERLVKRLLDSLGHDVESIGTMRHKFLYERYNWLPLPTQVRLRTPPIRS